MPKAIAQLATANRGTKMAKLVTLPDGQAVNPDDVAAVKIEQLIAGISAYWYVYVELRNHPRITISAAGKEDAQRIASQAANAINEAS